MTNNSAKIAAEVRMRIGNGYPDGVDQESHKQLPLLIRRIDLLEAALEKFARIATIPGNLQNEMAPCRVEDCKYALWLLQRTDEIERQQAIFPA